MKKTFDTSKYVVGSEPTQHENQTYLISMYVEASDGTLDVLGASHVTIDDMYEVRDMFIKAVGSIGLDGKKVKTVEMRHCTLDSFIENEMKGDSTVLSAPKFRYYLVGESKGGALGTPKWKDLPLNMFVSINKTTHGDGVYQRKLENHSAMIEDKTNAFEKDITEFFGIEHKMYKFLTKTIDTSVTNQQALEHIVGILREYKSAL